MGRYPLHPFPLVPCPKVTPFTPLSDFPLPLPPLLRAGGASGRLTLFNGTARQGLLADRRSEAHNDFVLSRKIGWLGLPLPPHCLPLPPGGGLAPGLLHFYPIFLSSEIVCVLGRAREGKS